MTNPTLERAARALADHFGCEWETMREADRETITGYCRAVLMAVLPELERYDPQDSGSDSWMAQINDGEYLRYDEIAAILKERE